MKLNALYPLIQSSQLGEISKLMFTNGPEYVNIFLQKIGFTGAMEILILYYVIETVS